MRELFDLGRRRGFITIDELKAALPEDQGSSKRFDDILEDAEDAGIEIVEPGLQGEVDSTDGDDEEPSAAPDREKIDDPVRLYLIQMAEIPLLPREDELRLAVRIDIGREPLGARVIEIGFSAPRPSRARLRGVAVLNKPFFNNESPSRSGSFRPGTSICRAVLAPAWRDSTVPARAAHLPVRLRPRRSLWIGLLGHHRGRALRESSRERLEG